MVHHHSMLSFVAFVGLALLSSATPLPEDAAGVYWWEFPQAECGYDDLLMNCAGDTLETCQDKCTTVSDVPKTHACSRARAAL